MQSALKKPAFPSLVKTTLAKGATVPAGFGPQPFDLSKCEIASDPLPAGRALPDGKYTAIFGSMKPGQCIKLPSDQVGRIAKALQTFCKKTNAQGVCVKSTSNYGDGMGRVWLWPTDK